MAKKDTIVIKPDTGFIVVQGKTYVLKKETFKKIDGVEHQNEIIFERVEEEQYKELISKIAKRLSKAVTKKKLMEELIKDMSLDEIKRIDKLLDNAETEIKPQDGCVGILIRAKGKRQAYVQLVK